MTHANPLEQEPTRLGDAAHRADDDTLRALLEAIDNAALIVNAVGDVQFVNAAAETLYARRAADLVGAPLGFNLPCPRTREIEIPRRGGEARLVRMRSVDTHWEGQAAHLVTLQDVTVLRRLEESLDETRQLAALGRLAGSVAHDFNNLLQAIGGHCEAIARRPRDSARVCESVDRIQHVCERAAPFVDRLLSFGRRDAAKPRVVDLNEVVVQMADFVGRLFGPQLRVETDRCSRPVLVEIDPPRIDQVLLNLSVNARDAMPDGGTLRFGVSRLDVKRGNGLKPGCYAALTVSDEGCGMDATTRARIFEPFFSTKQSGKGTGVGLATVREIIDEHGGLIRVDSRLGAGTTFKIFLPWYEAATPARPVRAARKLPANLTILVVEDEPEIRALLEEMLEPQAARVLSAGDGPEALQVAAAHGQGIDLLISDLSLPELDGREVASRLRKVSPDLPVVYISGHRNQRLTPSDTAGARASIVYKPFAQSDLFAAIASVVKSTPCVATSSVN